MAKITFSTPGPSDTVVSMLAQVMASWHLELVEHNVRIQIVWCAHEDGDAAVKHGGYPARAKVKLVKGADRVLKDHDAEIYIDEKKWEDLKQASRLALLDHECTHVVVSKKEDDDGNLVVQYDDGGRVVLKTRPGDANVGDMFLECIVRHGEAAIEFSNISDAHRIAQDALDERQEALDAEVRDEEEQGDGED